MDKHGKRPPEVEDRTDSVTCYKTRSDYYCWHYNHKGDAVVLTDGNGKLAAYYEYDAWGNTITEAEKSGVDNPYLHSTKEWDKKSGLYYFGARYYSPEIGRWTQRDPAGKVDGLNLYGHTMLDPISRLDEWGMWTGRTPNVFDLHSLNWGRCQRKFREAKRLLWRTLKRHEAQVKAWLVEEKCLCKGEKLPGLGDINLSPVPLPFGVRTNPYPFGRSTRVTLFDCNFIADKGVVEIASLMMHEYVHQLCGGFMFRPFGIMIAGARAENQAVAAQELVSPWLVE